MIKICWRARRFSEHLLSHAHPKAHVNPLRLEQILSTTMLLTLQDLLRLYCTILLLMILYVLFEIYEAGRQREPEVIDQHDPAFIINPEVIRNRKRG